MTAPPRPAADVVADLRAHRKVRVNDTTNGRRYHYEAHPIVVEAADLIERMAAIKKSVDGAYEHVVELYHAQRQEVEDAEQGRASLPDLVALWDAVHDDEPVVYGTGGMDLTIRKILRNLTHKETP